MMRKEIPLLLILALLLCGCGGEAVPETSAPTQQPTQTTESVPVQTEPEATDTTQPTEPERLPAIFWEDNMLRQDFLEVLGIPRARIRTATFLSIRREAPEEAVELSSGSGSVLGWVQEDEHLFIAADSGINGAESAQGLFAGCISLESVSFGNAYRTDQVKSLEGMFLGCKSLTQADVENLDVSSANHMGHIFSGCISLTQIKVEGWNPLAATDMEGMFRGCISLERLDISAWQPEVVRLLKGMFEGCTALRQLALEGWELPAARNMEAMFKDCAVLTRIDGFPFDHTAIDATTFTGCDLLSR